MFGGYAFGQLYFAGAERTGTKTITSTGDCTLAPPNCSGTGTAPQHGSTYLGGGGFFPFPMVQRRKLVTGIAWVEVAAPICAGAGETWLAFIGSGAMVLAPMTMQASAVNISAISRDELLLNIAMQLGNDG